MIAVRAVQEALTTGGNAKRRRYPIREIWDAEVRGYTCLECPACGGRMRILAAVHPPDAIGPTVIAILRRKNALIPAIR
jgi:hypothetical protein